MVIRAETPSDHAAIRDVVTGAFVDHPEEVAELVDAIRASANYMPDLAIVAMRDDRVAGFVMCSFAELVNGDSRHRVLTLSPLAVAPQHQRTGIGTMLVEFVLRRAADLGEPLVVLEGSPTYYARFGFEPAGRYGIKIPLPDWVPAEAAQVRLLPGYDSAIRGRLEYPPAFDAVAAH